MTWLYHVNQVEKMAVQSVTTSGPLLSTRSALSTRNTTDNVRINVISRGVRVNNVAMEKHSVLLILNVCL